MSIEVKEEFGKIMEGYRTNSKREPVRTIIYGAFGTGKTTCAVTGRPPILVHSFDPGGTKSVGSSDLIDNNLLALDRRYENEDPSNPTAYSKWGDEMNRLRRGGLCDKIGTFVLDSFTKYSEYAMNKVLMSSKTDFQGVAQLQDYNRLIATVKRDISVICSLPCDVVMTAHIDTDKDEITGRIETEMLAVGKLKRYVPLMFDEMYVSQVKNTSGGGKFELLTRSNGICKARTRIGSGKFDMFEEPNLMKLYDKAGLNASGVNNNTKGGE